MSAEAFAVGDVVMSPSGNHVVIIAVNEPLDDVCHSCGQEIKGRTTHDIQWPHGSIWKDMDLSGCEKVGEVPEPWLLA